MADVTGFVKSVYVSPALTMGGPSFAGVFIGFFPNNVELFAIGRLSNDDPQVADFKNMIVDQAAKAMRNGEIVRVTFTPPEVPVIPPGILNPPVIDVLTLNPL